jgi:transcriptional regulator with XRE-family HTH domain
MKNVREKRGLKQTDVCLLMLDRANVRISQATLSFIESLRMNPYHFELAAIALALRWDRDPRLLLLLQEEFDALPQDAEDLKVEIRVLDT